jgi:hypothetical protein
MKSMKKIITVVAVVGVLGAAGFAYAADIKTPADVVAALTGKSVTDLNKERASGKTYGTIANDAGKLAEFKTQMLEQKKSVLDARVSDGKITQPQADDIYNAIKTNQATCDGTGNEKIGKKNGVGFGNGQGTGSGKGQGMGRGARMGGGMSNVGCGVSNN